MFKHNLFKTSLHLIVIVAFAIVVFSLSLAFIPAVVMAGDVASPESPPEKIAEPVLEQPVKEKRRIINIRQLQSMEFGMFTSDVAGGSVIISPNGLRSVRGDISLLNRGSYGAAEFEISGHPGEMVMIYLPDNVTLSGGKGGARATITRLTSNRTEPFALDVNGLARVKIGGTLNLSGSAAAGDYSGNFSIDVRYIK